MAAADGGERAAITERIRRAEALSGSRVALGGPAAAGGGAPSRPAQPLWFPLHPVLAGRVRAVGLSARLCAAGRVLRAHWDRESRAPRAVSPLTPYPPELLGRMMAAAAVAEVSSASSSSSDTSSTGEEERMRRLFQTCDGDGDGFISR